MKVCKWFPSCPLKKFYETGNLEEHWIKDYCQGNYEECIRYKMESLGKPHPDNMLPTGEIKKSLK